MKKNKLFIILVHSIGNMGGAQMFAANKLRYYDQIGWQTSMYYAMHYPIIIESLKRYDYNYDNRMIYGPYCYTKKQRTDIISKIIPNWEIYDEIIIESHLLNSALWGELLAEYVNGKHIINVLDEGVYNPTRATADYIKFKLERGEWMNQGEKVLSRYLGKYYACEYAKYNFNMIPYCSNVVEDIESNIRFASADYTILSIGRLNKSYIIPMTLELRDFCKNTKFTFNIIYIGDSPDKNDTEYIKNMYSDCCNVNLYMIGYMLPIPKSIITKSDVAIASSNSVIPTYKLGIPTISIDGKDNKAIGIYGETTWNTVFRDNEPICKLQDLLCKIIIEKKYNKKNLELNRSIDDGLIEAFEPQRDFVTRSSIIKSYYDVVNIYPLKMRIFYNCKSMVKMLLIKLKNKLRSYSKCE